MNRYRIHSEKELLLEKPKPLKLDVYYIEARLCFFMWHKLNKPETIMKEPIKFTSREHADDYFKALVAINGNKYKFEFYDFIILMINIIFLGFFTLIVFVVLDQVFNLL